MGKIQFVNWFPQWMGFKFWHYPRDWQLPLCYGVCFLFFEVRYFPKRVPKKQAEESVR